MHVERLERMENLLRSYANNEPQYGGFSFNLSMWLVTGPTEKYSNACGVTGCAIGLAMLMGTFKDDGLVNYKGHPTFQSKIAFEAIELLFELDWHTARLIFSQGQQGPGVSLEGREGALATADRIRQVLDEYLAAQQRVDRIYQVLDKEVEFA